MSGRGGSKCSRKLTLSIFFAIELIAFTLCLVALLSPSWQSVYLENGRTEHHHGLWLDCKRDYSFDYGRTREYYETLYRRDLQGSPFAMFFLPPLQCVYKFDYYIDQEDLYDHNHDENRIQNDAYQHLFLGWKIAALAACGVAVIISAASLLCGICSYCHRTFICASTVLVTMAGIMAVVGLIVFYMWANYQDNKVIKEEDEKIYEQSFGWAFQFHAVGTFLHCLASLMGCCATSVSFQKGKAKLVKIEVVEGGSEENSLLASSSHLSSQPFKRSFSAVYRVDSEALRKWEKEYMKNMKNNSVQSSQNFKRTASVPNFSKKQRKEIKRIERESRRSQQDLFTSTSNVFSDRTETTNATNSLESNRGRRNAPIGAPMTPKSIMKKSNQSLAHIPPPALPDSTYEYMPCDSSIGLSTFRPTSSKPESPVKPAYDPVYEELPGDAYLKPDSLKYARNSSSTISEDFKLRKALQPTMPIVSGSAQSIPTPRATMIDDVVERPATSQELFRIRERITKEQQTIEELRRRQMRMKEPNETEFGVENKPSPVTPKSIMRPPSTPSRNAKPSLGIRDFGIDLSRKENGYMQLESQTGSSVSGESERRLSDTSSAAAAAAARRLSPPILSDLSHLMREPLRGSTRAVPEERKAMIPTGPAFRPSPSISTDTTRPPSQIAINTFGLEGSSRSITNLAFRPNALSSSVEVFERPDSVDLSSSISSLPKKTPTSLHRRVLGSIPDEVDRSVGSSTLLENECLRSDTPSTYVRDAEVRINLFLNDKNSTKDSETTV